MRDIRYCLHCGKVIQNNNKLYCCAYCQRHSSARAKKCSETYQKKSEEEKLNIKEKQKDTFLKKYGVTNPVYDKGVIDKIKSHYSDEFFAKRTKKQEQTCLKLYGETSYSKTQKHRNMASKVLHTERANKERERVFLGKYGTTSFLGAEESKKYKNTPDVIEKLRESSKRYRCSLSDEQKLSIVQKSINTRKKNGTLYKSKKESIWLTELGIPDDSEHRQVQIFVDGKHLFNVDGFEPTTKTVYEFLGDYFHGHPITRPNNKLFTETNNRFIKLKQLGYSVAYCWENDFKTDKKFIRYFEKDLEY